MLTPFEHTFAGSRGHAGSFSLPSTMAKNENYPHTGHRGSVRAHGSEGNDPARPRDPANLHLVAARVAGVS